MPITKGYQQLVAEAMAQVTTYSVEEVRARLHDPQVQIVDIRDIRELAQGTLPGAYHASRGMLEFKLSSNPELSARDRKIVLYCKTSGRAALAAASLLEMGYLDVKSIAGGFDAWMAAGKTVVKPSVPSFE